MSNKKFLDEKRLLNLLYRVSADFKTGRSIDDSALEFQACVLATCQIPVATAEFRLAKAVSITR